MLLQVSAARQREETLQQLVDSNKAELESLLQRMLAATEHSHRLQVGLWLSSVGPHLYVDQSEEPLQRERAPELHFWVKTSASQRFCVGKRSTGRLVLICCQAEAK